MKREEIWNPNLVIKHRVDHHDIEPEFISFSVINKQVTFLYDIIVKIACPMNFDRYPFDEQNCEFWMYNNLNTLDTMKFTMKELNPKYTHSSESRYDINLSKPNTTIHIAKFFSMVSLNFNLKRRTAFYLSSMYLPSTLLVGLSWMR